MRTRNAEIRISPRIISHRICVMHCCSNNSQSRLSGRVKRECKKYQDEPFAITTAINIFSLIIIYPVYVTVTQKFPFVFLQRPDIEILQVDSQHFLQNKRGKYFRLIRHICTSVSRRSSSRQQHCFNSEQSPDIKMNFTKWLFFAALLMLSGTSIRAKISEEESQERMGKFRKMNESFNRSMTR